MSPSSEPFFEPASLLSREPSTKLCLALICFAALMVRAVVFSTLFDPEHALAPVSASAFQGDALLYHEWAAELAAGRDPYADRAWWHPQLFPLIAQQIYALFGPDPRFVFAFQGACGLASLLLFFFWARTIVGARAALAGSLLATFYLPACFFETRFLPTTLATLLAMSTLFFLRRAELSRHARMYLLAAGLSAGLACLARPNLLPFALLLVAWIAWQQRPHITRTRALIMYACALALPIGASTLRNLRHGEPVLLCANGGINLYLANHAQAEAYFVPPDSRWTRIADQERAAREAIAAERGHPVNAAETSRAFSSQALDIRLADPLDTLQLMLRKARAYFGNVEAGVFDMPQVERELAPTLWIAPVPFALLLALAVAGLFALRREERRALIPALLLLICGACVAVFFFHYSRLRLPALGLIFLGAGVALARWRTWVRTPIYAIVSICVLIASWPDWERLIPLRRPQIYVEQVLRRLQSSTPIDAQELAASTQRMQALREENQRNARNELILATEALLAERSANAAALATALRALISSLEAEERNALSDGLRIQLAVIATPELEAALRAVAPASKPPLFALETIKLLELLHASAQSEYANALLQMRLGFLIARTLPGGDPHQALDRALVALHSALRYAPRNEREATEITAAALYFRGGTFDQMAALPSRRAQRDELLERALRDYGQAVQVLYGKPPTRNFEFIGPALALGYLGKERVAHGHADAAKATALADRVLEAREALRVD